MASVSILITEIPHPRANFPLLAFRGWCPRMCNPDLFIGPEGLQFMKRQGSIRQRNYMANQNDELNVSTVLSKVAVHNVPQPNKNPFQLIHYRTEYVWSINVVIYSCGTIHNSYARKHGSPIDPRGSRFEL